MLGDYPAAIWAGRAASQAYAKESARSAAWAGERVAYALAQAGRYADAADWYLWWASANDGESVSRGNARASAAACEAWAGNRAKFEEVSAAAPRDIADAKLDFVVEAYRDMLHGRDVDAEALARKARNSHSYEAFRHETILQALLDLHAHRQDHRPQLGRLLRRNPADRLGAVLAHAYDRQTRDADWSGFYAPLDRFHPDDPFVAAAQAAWRESGGKPKTFDVAAMREALRAFPGARTIVTSPAALVDRFPPWDVAAAVAGLVESHDSEGALSLAREYQRVLNYDGSAHLRAAATRLVREAEAARPAGGP